MSETDDKPVLPSRYYVKRTYDRDAFLADGESAWQEAPILPHMVKKDWISPIKVLEQAKTARAMELILAQRDITMVQLANELDVDYRKLRRILNGPGFQAKMHQELDARGALVVGMAWDWIEGVLRKADDDEETRARKDAMARFVVVRDDKIRKMLQAKPKKGPQSTKEIAQGLMELARQKAQESGQKVQIGMAVSAEPGDQELTQDLGDLSGETFGVEVEQP